MRADVRHFQPCYPSRCHQFIFSRCRDHERRKIQDTTFHLLPTLSSFRPTTSNVMANFAGDRLVLMGTAMVAIGTAGFYYIPGMIAEDAEGSRLVNSLYVSEVLE